MYGSQSLVVFEDFARNTELRISGRGMRLSSALESVKFSQKLVTLAYEISTKSASASLVFLDSFVLMSSSYFETRSVPFHMILSRARAVLEKYLLMAKFARGQTVTIRLDRFSR